jgi:guanine deaminase
MQGNPIFMQQAIDLATANVVSGKGGPFGCVIVRNGEVIATGANCVTSHNDPTAHAEVTAIRAACKKLNSFQLTECEVYTSCEPCPMCLAALYWSRCAAIYYGNTAADAASIGFDDAFLYDELKKPLNARAIPTLPLLHKEAFASFTAWQNSPNRIDY